MTSLTISNTCDTVLRDKPTFRVAFKVAHMCHPHDMCHLLADVGWSACSQHWTHVWTHFTHTNTYLPFHWFLILGCGGTLTTATGAFSSPNFPLPYHPNAECYWNIRTNHGSQLLLSFSDFHLESSSTCSFDYLAVSSAPQSVTVSRQITLKLGFSLMIRNCWHGELKSISYIITITHLTQIIMIVFTDEWFH